MRSLPNLANVPLFEPTKTLRIAAADAATTWIFSGGLIQGISPITWECNFLGGLAHTANYRVSLVGSPSAIKDMLRDGGLVGATATLQVDIASNQFTPHIGTVRGFERDQPNAITLVIVDRTLDNDPLLPNVALTDSWATPHLEHLVDGEHWYYGLQVHPFYMTAIQSNAGLFLGPRNVSSQAHMQSSLWLLSDLEGKAVPSNTKMLLLNKSWQQQSGSSNVGCGNTPGFEIVDRGLPNKFASFDSSLIELSNVRTDSLSQLLVSNISYFQALAHVYSGNIPPTGGNTIEGQVTIAFINNLGLAVASIGHINLVAVQSNWNASVNSQFAVSIVTETSTGLGLGSTKRGGGPTFTSCFEVTSDDGFFNGANRSRLQITLDQGSYSTAAGVTIAVSATLSLNLGATAYKRFSVLGNTVNSTFVAISTNPLAILDHVHSWQTSIPFRQDQSSDAQVAVQSYAFNGYVGPERARWSKLMGEFASITGVYVWLGDSGMVNYRAYANSGAATVNASISEQRDMLRDTFRLREAPIGSTLFEAEQFAKVVGRYDYSFHAAQYNASVTRTNSIVGNNKTAEFSTKWITNATVASMWANTLAARLGSGKLVAQFDVGPQRLDLELGDVINVAHPMIVGSSTLMQIKQISLDLQAWKQSIVAVELVARA